MMGTSIPPGTHALPAVGNVLEFLRLIWSVDHALQRSSKRMQAAIGLTGPQRLVLRIVGRFPGIAAGHLAQLFHVHPSTLTGVLSRLERRGLIRRCTDPSDGRRSLLAISAKGRDLELRATGTIEEAIRSVIERTPPLELDAARGVLQSVASALEARFATAGIEPPGSGHRRRRSTSRPPRSKR